MLSSVFQTRGEFQWESSVQGLILSSINMLGFIMPLMTDYLSRQVGGKSLLLVSTGLSGALTVLQPPGARLSPYALVALRMALGMFGVSVRWGWGGGLNSIPG